MWSAEVVALIVNILVCVVGLTASSYDFFLAPARIAMGVTLAALLCLPRFDGLTRRGGDVVLRRVLWLGPCAALWLLLAHEWWTTMARVYPG